MIRHDLNQTQYGFESYLSQTVGMDQDEIELITQDLRREKFDKGSVLLRNGEVCQSSFLWKEDFYAPTLSMKPGKST